MTKEEILKEIDNLKDQLALKREEYNKLSRSCVKDYENKYYINDDYGDITLLFISNIDYFNNDFYFSSGSYLHFHNNDEEYDDESFMIFNFSNDNYYEFRGCHSFEDVVRVLNNDFKEITKEEYYNRIIKYNKQFSKYISEIYKA